MPSLPPACLRSPSFFTRLPAPLFTCAVLAAALTLGGCRADLGECDPNAARQVVYLRTGVPGGDPNDGLPMFAGQALLHTSCGNGSECHSSAARAGENVRHGVPLGLDFDLAVPCDDSGCLPGAVERLRESQATAYRHREHILRTVQRGTMPPRGSVGDAVVGRAPNYVFIDTEDIAFTGGVEQGILLPPVDSRASQDILRNWLACGLPVIERAQEPTLPTDSGSFCRGSTDCVWRVAANADPVEPTWTDIYDRVIGPKCGDQCHQPGDATFDDHELDLSDPTMALSNMVGGAAFAGGMCGGGTIIVAGDPDASLLVDKMENEQPSCGDPMPSGGLLEADETMQAIRQWITDGALDN